MKFKLKKRPFSIIHRGCTRGCVVDREVIGVNLRYHYLYTKVYSAFHPVGVNRLQGFWHIVGDGWSTAHDICASEL